MKPVIIFGAGKIAEVVQYYMTHESNLDVAAFTCDREYVQADQFEGVPRGAIREGRNGRKHSI